MTRNARDELSNQNSLGKKSGQNLIDKEIRRREKAKKVRVLSSHLIRVFNINANDDTLVLAFSNDIVSSNIEAIKIWIGSKLTDENEQEVKYWESTVERILSTSFFNSSSY